MQNVVIVRFGDLMSQDLRLKKANKTRQKKFVIEYMGAYARYNLQIQQINNVDTYIPCLICSQPA